MYVFAHITDFTSQNYFMYQQWTDLYLSVHWATGKAWHMACKNLLQSQGFSFEGSGSNLKWFLNTRTVIQGVVKMAARLYVPSHFQAIPTSGFDFQHGVSCGIKKLKIIGLSNSSEQICWKWKERRYVCGVIVWVWMSVDFWCSEAVLVRRVYKAGYCRWLCAWWLLTVPRLFRCDRHCRWCWNNLLVSIIELPAYLLIFTF